MEPLLLPGDDEAPMMAAINVTPMVDIMLVLFIVFLVTVPAIVHTVPVKLPRETSEPSRIRPGTVNLSITADGRVFWNERWITGTAALADRINKAARQRPQPEIDIRGDLNATYEPIGQVVALCQQAGIGRLGFVTEPRLPRPAAKEAQR